MTTLHPACPPARRVIEGRLARLEPLDPIRHGPDLWRAVEGHDHVWDYMAYGPFGARSEFTTWLDSRARLDDPLCFAILDAAARRPLGWATLMEIRPAHGVIEVGHIVFSPALQKTPIATEAIFLLMAHAFDDLGNRRFEWKCDDGNAPSKRAARRFGFTFEGVFRQHMIVKGRNRDTAWFSIIDSEWPTLRDAFIAWLAPDNFDTTGRQRRALAAFRDL